MSKGFIDIHTHHHVLTYNTFQIWNQVIGQDTYQEIPMSAGIHPWYIQPDNESQWQELNAVAKLKNVLAIGECGLDKQTNTSFDQQIKLFSKQIVLANEIGKPLIIHCVRAYGEVMQQLKIERNKMPVLFHGVHKKMNLINALHSKGYYTSFGSYILQGQLDEVIKTVELNKIFLETDNKSISIIDIYQYFCRVRNISVEQLQDQLLQNVSDVFNYNAVIH